MVLSLSKRPQALRNQLATAFSLSSSADLSWQLGQLSDTPSTAFFIGYQAAMRCLDPSLPVGKWAAFLVSEKGVRNPFESRTVYDPSTSFLEGEKSHVMLAPSGLDVAYVLARKLVSSPVELVLLKIDAVSLQVGPINSQPFLLEVPHYPVKFSVILSSSAHFCDDAHQQANKPFRYWEDVHTALSLSGWLQAQLRLASKELEQTASALIQAFKESPHAYELTTLTLVEQLINKAQYESVNLADNYKEIWVRDTLLLKFSQAIRDKIRQNLLRVKG